MSAVGMRAKTVRNVPPPGAAGQRSRSPEMPPPMKRATVSAMVSQYFREKSRASRPASALHCWKQASTSTSGAVFSFPEFINCVRATSWSVGVFGLRMGRNSARVSPLDCMKLRSRSRVSLAIFLICSPQASRATSSARPPPKRNSVTSETPRPAAGSPASSAAVLTAGPLTRNDASLDNSGTGASPGPPAADERRIARNTLVRRPTSYPKSILVYTERHSQVCQSAVHGCGFVSASGTTEYMGQASLTALLHRPVGSKRVALLVLVASGSLISRLYGSRSIPRRYAVVPRLLAVFFTVCTSTSTHKSRGRMFHHRAHSQSPPSSYRRWG